MLSLCGHFPCFLIEEFNIKQVLEFASSCEMLGRVTGTTRHLPKSSQSTKTILREVVIVGFNLGRS